MSASDDNHVQGDEPKRVEWYEALSELAEIATDVLLDPDSELGERSARRLSAIVQWSNVNAAANLALEERRAAERHERDRRRRSDALMRTVRRKSAIVDGPGGISRLSLHSSVHWPLSHADVLTVDEVRRGVDDGSILAVPGIGPKRLEELRRALEDYDSRDQERSHAEGSDVRRTYPSSFVVRNAQQAGEALYVFRMLEAFPDPGTAEWEARLRSADPEVRRQVSRQMHAAAVPVLAVLEPGSRSAERIRGLLQKFGSERTLEVV